MKKFFSILLIIGLLVIGYTSDVFLYAKKLISGEPTTHSIKNGEYLSEIAQKYYGRADYWQELALVNRAPDSDLIFPGEEIIIPSKEVIEKIRRTRWLSRVNRYVKGQENMLAGRLDEQQDHSFSGTVPETMSESELPITELENKPLPNKTVEAQKNEAPAKSSLPYFLLAAIGIVFITAMIILILYRKRKRAEQFSIIDNLELTDKNEESEPDYNQYLRNKKKKDEEIVVNLN